MSERIANRVIICEKLQEFAKVDETICIVTSDSRGSASLLPFAKEFPDKVIEVGIAEQNLVGIAAGLAANHMKPYVASPACFLTTRAIEQIKVDVAYSNTNVKLIGISAGVSYGALGMTHHSLQDIAYINAIPNMTIVVPADYHETRKLMDSLQIFAGPTYIRVGRNAVESVHENEDFEYQIGKAITMCKGDDITLVACGEMVSVALKSAEILKEKGVSARVINMHTIKPLDTESIITAAKETKAIITLEEHSIHGGLGSIVSAVVSENYPCFVKRIAMPDDILVAGESEQLFEHYKLTKENVAREALRLISLKETKGKSPSPSFGGKL